MLVKTNAIVLSALKYSETDIIVKCYTQQFGVVSYVLKGILKRKSKTMKMAHFQLLSQVQLNADHKNNRGLQYIKEVKVNHLYHTLHTNILKSSVVMFLAEILTNVLQEEEQNTRLYQYLETTLQWLDTQDHYANFHLLFLLKLTKHLGFYPEENWQENPDFFNLKEGRFQSKNTSNYCVSGENLTLLKQLLGTNFEALHSIKISSKQRQSFLTMLLAYFNLHLGNFKNPKSLEVFNQVFN